MTHRLPNDNDYYGRYFLSRKMKWCDLNKLRSERDKKRRSILLVMTVSISEVIGI